MKLTMTRPRSLKCQTKLFTYSVRVSCSPAGVLIADVGGASDLNNYKTARIARFSYRWQQDVMIHGR